MPYVPKQTKCAYLGCGNERSPLNSFCMEHGGKGFNDSIKRKRSNAKYNTTYWARTRTAQLSRQPLCQSCALENRVNGATEVDHLFAWNQLGEEAFAVNVFQSLCKNCHTVKTGLEQRGIFRHYKPPKPTDYKIEDWYAVVTGEGVATRLNLFWRAKKI